MKNLGIGTIRLLALAMACHMAHAADNGDSDVQAYYRLKTLAEQGDAEAAYALGQRLEAGEGIVQDLPGAFYWYEQAAQGGVEAAKQAWGELDDLATPDADEMFARAITGDAYAMLELGDLYARGYHVPQDSRKAQHWRAQARDLLVQEAQAGDVRAQWRLALLLRGEDDVLARDWLERAHALARGKDDAYERTVLSDLAAVLLQMGDGGSAEKYYRDVADLELKSAFAQTLGILHFRSGDKAGAQSWLLQASVPTRAVHYYLGRLYEDAQDIPKARGHYLQAAEYTPKYENAAILWQAGGDPCIAAAEYRLGGLAANSGNGEQARQWYAQAGKRGHAHAQYELGRDFLARGDAISAQYWLEQAAANRHQEALLALAERAEQSADTDIAAEKSAMRPQDRAAAYRAHAALVARSAQTPSAKAVCDE